MIVYSYDINGIYNGEVEADESPLEPGVYLMPARTTRLPPLPPREGLSVIFVGSNWTYAIAERQPDDEVIIVPAPTTVSSRQFRLQLLKMGLHDIVRRWVATQSGEVKIAFEYSGSFVRTEPMMVQGFQALGFTEEQVDNFFIEASKL